jgi:hypothetical protein
VTDHPVEATEMEVEYALDEHDYVAFQRYYMDHRRGAKAGLLRRNWVLIAFCLFVGLLLITSSLINKDGIYWRGIVLGACALSAPVILYFFRRPLVDYQMRRMIRRSPEALDVMRLSIDPEGITSSKRGSALTTIWPRVEAIGLTESHAFFLLPGQSGLILPRRAFPSDEAFNRFVGEAQRRYEKAVTGSGWDRETRQGSPPTGVQPVPGSGDDHSSTGILGESQVPQERQPGPDE